jgi:YVTN family beta-propeller protein
VLSNDGTVLYVTDTTSGRVAPVELNHRQVQRPISVGQRPLAAAITPEGNLLLVVNEGSSDLAIVRTRTNSLLTLVPVGLRPRDVAVKMF